MSTYTGNKVIRSHTHSQVHSDLIPIPWDQGIDPKRSNVHSYSLTNIVMPRAVLSMWWDLNKYLVNEYMHICLHTHICSDTYYIHIHYRYRSTYSVISTYHILRNTYTNTPYQTYTYTQYTLHSRPPAWPHLMYVTPRQRVPACFNCAPSTSSWLSERVLI